MLHFMVKNSIISTSPNLRFMWHHNRYGRIPDNCDRDGTITTKSIDRNRWGNTTISRKSRDFPNSRFMRNHIVGTPNMFNHIPFIDKLYRDFWRAGRATRRSYSSKLMLDCIVIIIGLHFIIKNLSAPLRKRQSQHHRAQEQCLGLSQKHV